MRITELELCFYKIGLRLGYLRYCNSVAHLGSLLNNSTVRLITADLHRTFKYLGAILPLRTTSLGRVARRNGRTVVNGLFDPEGIVDNTTKMEQEIALALQELVQQSDERTRCSNFLEIGIQIGRQWHSYDNPGDASTAGWGDPESIERLLRNLDTNIESLIDFDITEEKRSAFDNAEIGQRPLHVDFNEALYDCDPIEFGLARLERQTLNSEDATWGSSPPRGKQRNNVPRKRELARNLSKPEVQISLTSDDHITLILDSDKRLTLTDCKGIDIIKCSCIVWPMANRIILSHGPNWPKGWLPQGYLGRVAESMANRVRLARKYALQNTN